MYWVLDKSRILTACDLQTRSVVAASCADRGVREGPERGCRPSHAERARLQLQPDLGLPGPPQGARHHHLRGKQADRFVSSFVFISGLGLHVFY